MKRFIFKLFLFFLLATITFLPIDYFISFHLKKSKIYSSGEYTVWNDIYNGNINADLLIFGSSRAFNHINPLILEDSLNISAYNLGIEGHNFWLEYFRYSEYRKHNKKPKYILISIDMWMLDKRYDLYNNVQFLPYMLFNKDIYQFTNSYKGFKFFDYYFPLVRYIGQRKSVNESFNMFLNIPDTLKHRIKGFGATEGEWNDDFDRARDSMRYYKAEPHLQTVELFDKFIADCKKEDVKLFFVYTPEYIEGQAFTINRAEIMSIFSGLSQKEGIVFIDYSDNEICKHKENFLNASHLNEKNSLIFSRMLASDLKKYFQH